MLSTPRNLYEEKKKKKMQVICKVYNKGQFIFISSIQTFNDIQTQNIGTYIDNKIMQ